MSNTDRIGNLDWTRNSDIKATAPDGFAKLRQSPADEDIRPVLRPSFTPHPVTKHGSSHPKVSILMCAFNEQERIGQAIQEVLTTPYPCAVELIIVDDGSTDGTAEIVEQYSDPRITLHRHTENKGKGAALRTASDLATGTHILPFDADLEYSSEDIPRLIEPIMKRRYEVVYGVRLFGFNTVYQSYRYAMGNRLLTRAVNILFDANLSDLHTCLKLIPLELFRSLDLRESGFGLDTEVTAALLRLGIRPFEVPVSYYSRSHSQGKKINWRDAFVCLAILLRVRMARLTRLRPPTGEEEPARRLQGAADGRVRPEIPNLAALHGAAFSAGGQNSEEANAVATG
ncbi:MAG: glycosyltransferase family 2 protein [Streptosporangiaceae bacterium]